MKTAMLILGIIGAFAGFGGSIMTVIGGIAGTAAGVLIEENKTAMTGAMVFWAGVYTSIISAFALISSIVGGVGKAKTTIQTFSISNVVLGAVSIYLFNFVSGGLILVAGILGLIGAKSADQQEKSILKSGLFYFIAIILVAAVTVSIAIRNANDSRATSDKAKVNSKTIQPLPHEKTSQQPGPKPVETPDSGPQPVESPDDLKEKRTAMMFIIGRWTEGDASKCPDPLVIDNESITFKSKKLPAVYKKRGEDYCLDTSTPSLRDSLRGIWMCGNAEGIATVYDEADEQKNALEKCK